MRGAATAVVSGERRLSYEEVWGRSGVVSERLRQLGVGMGAAAEQELVAVVMERGWEQVVGVLGIVRSGAAYVPVDVRWPWERVRQVLADSGVRVVLTQGRVAARLGWPAGLELVAVEELGPAAGEELEEGSSRGKLAYVMYTSGSTGEPKGVMIEQQSVVNTIEAINKEFGVGSGDSVLALSSLSFDLSVYDIFGVLSAGGRVVLPGVEEERDPGAWRRLLEQEAVTLWNSVPALMEMLVESAEGGGERWRLPGSLRLVLLSGDRIALSLPERIWFLGKDVQLVSLGGATEASIWSILYPIQSVQPSWTRQVNSESPCGAGCIVSTHSWCVRSV